MNQLNKNRKGGRYSELSRPQYLRVGVFFSSINILRLKKMVSDEQAKKKLAELGVNTRRFNSFITVLTTMGLCTEEAKQLFQEEPIKMDEYIIKNHPTQSAEIQSRIEAEIRRKDSKDEKERTMVSYIFDPSKNVKRVAFTFIEFDYFCAFGILLPKIKDLTDRKGKSIGKKQINNPVIITSEGNILEVDSAMQERYKIDFKLIPQRLDLRWSQQSVEAFLQGKSPNIEGKDLFQEIREIYKNSVYFNDERWYTTHALWDIGTYFFMLFKTYPIFELRGLMGTGKTKIMQISSCITLNATDIMVNPSESVLFRETDEKRPTKYIDEAEKLFRIEKGKQVSDSRVEVINSGYTSGASVPRMEKEGERWVTKYYETYSPTMIGSIAGLQGATENRAFVHICVKAPSDDTRGNIEINPHDTRWETLRDKCYLFTMQQWKDVKSIYQNLKPNTSLRNRSFQIWKPLFSIAKSIDEVLYDQVKQFAEELEEMRELDNIPEGSTEYNIIMAVYELLKDGSNPILIKAVAAKLPNDFKPSNKTIAHHLDSFGFREYKVRASEGTCYRITPQIFEIVIRPQFPSLATFLSLSSSQSKSNVIFEEKVQDNEENVAGEQNERTDKTVKDDDRTRTEQGSNSSVG